jgi:nitrogen fixation/metabolism regulation signal transduction histidine kinase
MKRYHIALLSRLIALVFAFTLAGFLLASHWYYTALTACGIGCYFFFTTVRFLKRTVKDAGRLIDAIHYSELNISFRNFAQKGLFPALIPRMENAIVRFNEKLNQTEIEHQFYDTLLNRIDSPILVIGHNHDIEWINKAALDEFGNPQPRKTAEMAAFAPGLPGVLEKIVPGEAKIIKTEKAGHTRQFAVTAVLFISRGKELKLVSFKNIQSVLEESETGAWEKIIRVLMHEMMNSITPIISLAETFTERELTTANDYALMSKAMQTIHRRSKGLVDFVGNYRKYANIPAPVRELFDAREMMKDINDLLQAGGIRFSYDIKPDDLALFADRSQMEQVLINLIKNAWEACTANPSSEIKVKLTKNDYQRTVIVVTDNGCGILPGVSDKIFVPFFTTKHGGSGIGLSICRQIMISHGGTITVDSQPDRGTRVVLSL